MRLLLQLGEEFLYLVEGTLDGFHGIGVGDADEVLAAVAEGSAGNDGDVLRFEQRVGELLSVHTGGLHARERVESALPPLPRSRRRMTFRARRARRTAPPWERT